VPALGNSFISLLKDTSLTSVITVLDIFAVAKQISARTFQPMLLYSEAALVYLIFSTFLTFLQSALEKKLGKHLQADTE
jgi:cystine transport system permease protein